jgi:hypothetical protein
MNKVFYDIIAKSGCDPKDVTLLVENILKECGKVCIDSLFESEGFHYPFDDDLLEHFGFKQAHHGD